MSLESTNQLDPLSYLDFYTFFPKLTRSELKTILSEYGYLRNDFSINDLVTYIPDGDKLLPDGILQVLWAEYPFVGTLTKHPFLIKSELQTEFNTNKTTFLRKLDPVRVFSLLNDESTQTNTPSKIRHLFSWAATYGANRFLTMGTVSPTGVMLGWSNTSTPNSAPTLLTDPTVLKQRLDSFPDGYKGTYVTPYSFHQYNYTAGNFTIDDFHFIHSFASGAQRIVATDSFVSGIGGATSGSATYIVPSGYPGIYFADWNDGVKRASAYFQKCRDIGLDLQWLILDTESLNVSLWPYYIKSHNYYHGNGNSTPATSMGVKPWEQIVSDYRHGDFRANYPNVPPTGEIAYRFSTWPLDDGRTYNFTEATSKALARQFNAKVRDIYLSYFPSGKIANYDWLYRSAATHPSQIPFKNESNPSGIGAVMGNRQSTVTYLDMIYNGSSTGYIYYGWEDRYVYPPSQDYAWSNGVPHSGGFIVFQQGARTIRTANLASDVPNVGWVPSPIEGPNYPFTKVKSQSTTGAAQRKTGPYDYLYDEFIFYSLMNNEETLMYNPMDTNYLTTSIYGPGYPTSGNYALYYETDFHPTGLFRNNQQMCQMWLDGNNSNNIWNDTTGSSKGNLGQGVASWRDTMGNYHATGITSAAYPKWEQGKRAQTNAVHTNGVDQYLSITPIDQSVFTNGYTLMMVVSCSGYGGGSYLFGSRHGTDRTAEIWVYADGRPAFIDTAGFSTSKETFGVGADGSTCHVLIYTVDPNVTLGENADSLSRISFHHNGNDDSLALTNNQLIMSSGISTGSYFTGGKATNRWFIGASNNSNLVFTGWREGYFHDIMLFKGALTPNESRKVAAWAYNKHQPKNGNQDLPRFWTFPTRSDAKAANERTTAALLEFETVVGQYTGKSIKRSEPILHSCSGIVSSFESKDRVVHRVTPNPTLIDQLVVTQKPNSGVNFRINNWTADFPRGIITQVTNPIVPQPSGYWVVQPNRTDEDIIYWAHDRQRTVKTIFGYIPIEIIDPFELRHTTSATSAEVNNVSSSVAYIGQGSETISNPLSYDQMSLNGPVDGSTPVVNSHTTTATVGSVGTFADVRTTAPIASARIPNQANSGIYETITSDSINPDRNTPGEFTFTTGSPIPTQSQYKPKTG